MEAQKLKSVKKAYTIKAGDLDLANKHILEFHIFTPDGVGIEDILDPNSWKHIAYRLEPMAHIYVTSESGKYAGLVRVTNCTKHWAKTEVIWYKEFASAPTPVNESLEVAWAGNKMKWGVRRKNDKNWLKTGLKDEADAANAMANELKSMGIG